MFSTIVSPVDLAHAENLKKGLDVAVDLAKHYDASLTLLGVTSSAPGEVAHNPEEYAEKLSVFAKSLGDGTGVDVQTRVIMSNDPAVELESRLRDAAGDMNADLVVMSSHKPGLLEYIVSAHAVTFASHTERSVFIVR